MLFYAGVNAVVEDGRNLKLVGYVVDVPVQFLGKRMRGIYQQ